MNTPSYATYRDLFAGKPMPFAYVDLDLLHANIQAILKRAGDKKIRVASKSVRSIDVLKRIFAASPQFQGIMAFTPAEALHLSMHGFDDLLLGYPCWHEGQISDLCALIRDGKSITLMLDSVAHVEHLEKIAAKNGVTLPVCVDVDLSLDLPGLHFGVWRSSVTSAEDALRTYDAIARSPHVRLDGVMGYEAQIAGVGDNAPGARGAIIRMLKRRSVPQLRARRRAVVDALTSRGAELRFVNGGGTGSLESTREETCVTEVTVGSGFYSPALFDHYTAFRHLPAAGFAVEIVRQPKPGTYTCLGGGYIASGEIGKNKQPVPYLPIGAALTGLEGAGEVQTPVTYAGAETLKLGDPIFMRHSKAGELCERFNALYLLEGGKIVDEVTTYRGEGCSFL